MRASRAASASSRTVTGRLENVSVATTTALECSAASKDARLIASAPCQRSTAKITGNGARLDTRNVPRPQAAVLQKPHPARPRGAVAPAAADPVKIASGMA